MLLAKSLSLPPSLMIISVDCCGVGGVWVGLGVVRARARACVSVCARACVYVCVCMRACVSVRAVSYTHLTLPTRSTV